MPRKGVSYRLTRDDGEQVLVNGSIWESALELAFLYGWRPVGTETPRTESWRTRRAGAPAWDDQDYFSRASQHVGEDDARALGRAVLAALVAIPEWPTTEDRHPVPPRSGEPSPIPSRASAFAAGLTVSRRKLVRSVAVFAERGGFTIGASGSSAQ